MVVAGGLHDAAGPPARFVLHAVSGGFWEDDRVRPSRGLLLEIVNACLYHAETLNLKSLAFPLVGTGSAGFSPEICLDTMFRHLAAKLPRGLTSVRKVRIVLYGHRSGAPS
ncbi:MAG: macro domain-containing protein [Planctomycetota bacterium]